ncbi:uncharacterized protein PAC_14538 [Phialocephala subalpina]|uniref:Uncharacterized protein n=1 Tax=Phialocephala subalpina TaxID=576137 RepID=A0A1L7XHX1_9HELO|nr:uncharacterized protein PAC_14538 [Phialocephala subalpina]
MWRARQLLRNDQAVRKPIAVPRLSIGSQTRLPLSILQRSENKHGHGFPNTSLQLLQLRRNFSVHPRLHEQSAKPYFSVSQGEKKPRFRRTEMVLKFLWRAFIVYWVFNITVLAFPFPERLKYRWHKLRRGTDFADFANASPFMMAIKKEPDIVFIDYTKATNFVVISREDNSSSRDDVRLPGGRGGPGDPYERLWKRGPWGVEVENPKGEKKFYAALPTRVEDQPGDLRIEVRKGSYDVIGKYVLGLRDGDWVMVTGPRREKKSEVPV